MWGRYAVHQCTRLYPLFNFSVFLCAVLCVSKLGSAGGQQEEALIFSETSGSDLATRKRSRPPPRRIRSTALFGAYGRKWGREGESSYSQLSKDKVMTMGLHFLSLNQSISAINLLKRLTAKSLVNTEGRFLILSSISPSATICLHETTVFDILLTSGSLLLSDWSRSQPGFGLRSSVCRQKQLARRGSESGCKCQER